MAKLIALKKDVSVKLLESPCLYHRGTDELYEVGEEALDLITRCVAGAGQPLRVNAAKSCSTSGPDSSPGKDGTGFEDAGEDAASFIGYCLAENLMEPAGGPVERKVLLNQSPTPSLRYLLLHITDRCNLACRHCFQGPPGKNEMPLKQMAAVIDEFEQMQGLRLMISGGEPLMHKQFGSLNELLAERDLRSILLTNGTLIDQDTARRLNFQEVQVSLDGWEASHDFVRGQGSFELALNAIRLLLAAGKQVSVATMIHRQNLPDLEKMSAALPKLGISAWNLDVPSRSGRLRHDADFIPDPAVAGPLLEYSFGGAIHEPVAGYACGCHIAAVSVDGKVSRCGFYAGRAIGDIREGLAACWQKMKHVRLEELRCECEYLAQCRGGCRFRAGGYKDLYAPDLYQCFRHGVK